MEGIKGERVRKERVSERGLFAGPCRVVSLLLVDNDRREGKGREGREGKEGRGEREGKGDGVNVREGSKVLCPFAFFPFSFLCIESSRPTMMTLLLLLLAHLSFPFPSILLSLG